MGARKTLRSGFTTGACAAAAAKGAALLLLGRGPSEVRLQLPWPPERPDAREVSFPLMRCTRGEEGASCGVMKDAGDDPDVTDGLEVRATVSRHRQGSPEQGPVSVSIEGGEGVGRVTKPGLAVPVGRAAINPVPLAMIEGAVREALTEAGFRAEANLHVTISVPRGVEVAQKTLNSRLGIVGGLSILGTTGIVIPMSSDAWRATIDSSLDVARAAGLDTAVLSHGRSSEAAAKARFPDLPPEGFCLMGDHVGHALEACASRGLRIVLAGQFAKFCKVASGHFETHVKDSSLDLSLLTRLLRNSGFSTAEAEAALSANTAREVYEGLHGSGDRGVFGALCREVAEKASQRISRRVSVEAILFSYTKQRLASFRIPEA